MLADNLEEHVEALIEETLEDLASELASRIAPKLGGLVGELFRERLLAVVGLDAPKSQQASTRKETKRQTEAKVKRKTAAATRPPKEPTATKPKPAGVTPSGKLRQRAVMKCGKCGREGFRADGCGSSHEPLGKHKSDDGEDEGRAANPPVPPAKLPTPAAHQSPPPITSGPIRRDRGRCASSQQRIHRLPSHGRSPLNLGATS